MRSLVCILFSVSVLMCGADVPGLSVFHLHLVEMAKLRQVPLETVAHLRRAFAEFPTLGHVLDTGNYDFWKDDVLAAQEEFAGRIRHVHIKDRDRERPTVSVAAGTGTVPIREIVNRLVASGYANWITLECFGSTNMTADIRASSDYLRSLTKNR